MKKQFSTLLLAGVAASLAACGGDLQAPDPNPTPHDSPTGPGLFSGDSGNILDAFRDENSEGGAGTGLNINPFLWRSALESISFMPIIQADSNGGVIITDWYSSPESINERVKVNVYILSRSLRADGLRVSVFKQKRMNGAWENTPASTELVRQLEDTILTNARVLKVKQQASK